MMIKHSLDSRYLTDKFLRDDMSMSEYSDHVATALQM